MRTTHLIAAALLSTVLAAPAALAQNGHGGASSGANERGVVTFSPPGSPANAAENNSNASNNGANSASTSNADSSTQNAGSPSRQVHYLSNIPGLWAAKNLDGLPVYGEGNKQVGSISNILLDREGQVKAVVIAVGGGILGGGRTVAVPFDALQWRMTKTNNGGNGGGNATTGSGGANSNNNNSNNNNQHGPAEAILPGATQNALNKAPQFKVNGGQ